MTAVAARIPGARTWRGIPVVLPKWGDPRLKVSAVILSLQVLGQVALGFKLSIAQIVVTIGACALVEVAITYHRQRALIWPASALLTGNGVAFILRASGTEHGDWWSLNGIQWFLLAALLGLGSKYVLQVGGRHIYNPSNLGLVAVLLIVSTPRVFPQYLYWGDLSWPVLAALALILAGVVWILKPLNMLPMAAAFLAPFWLLVAVLAATGSCMWAIWATGPICGMRYWTYIATSPELLVFTFYMMSDPRTAPRAPRARLAYGLLTAAVAAGMIATQPTEYGVKVALLGALVAVCTVVPLLDRWLGTAPAPVAAAPGDRQGWAITPAAVAALLILLAVPAGVADLARNDDLLNLERGITPTGEPAVQ